MPKPPATSAKPLVALASRETRSIGRSDKLRRDDLQLRFARIAGTDTRTAIQGPPWFLPDQSSSAPPPPGQALGTAVECLASDETRFVRKAVVVEGSPYLFEEFA